MVRAVSPRERADRFLVRDLLEWNPEEVRCPHLKVDDTGPYCSKDLKGEAISAQRRYVCDPVSLQMWCLDKERAPICIHYKDERFKE
jgi:hypothetical protein